MPCRFWISILAAQPVDRFVEGVVAVRHGPARPGLEVASEDRDRVAALITLDQELDLHAGGLDYRSGLGP
jgi:hypothetical protein